MKIFFLIFILFLSFTPKVTTAATAYARGEFCYEDRFLGNFSDYDFNEACMRYHLMVFYSSGPGIVYEVVLALFPLHNGAQDNLSIVLNPGLSGGAYRRHYRSDDGTETTEVISAGDVIMSSSNMYLESCYGGSIPLFPSTSCISNAVVLSAYGTASSHLSFGGGSYDNTEEFIPKLIALRNDTYSYTIDHTSFENGFGKMMFKPVGSIIPSEKVHWFDAFVFDGATGDADESSSSNNISLSGCDPRVGNLSSNCKTALANFVTTQQSSIKSSSVGATTSIAASNSSSLGLRIAKYSDALEDFDPDDRWSMGTSDHYLDGTRYTRDSKTFDRHSDLVEYVSEENHGSHRLFRTRCDYIKCVWYSP